MFSNLKTKVRRWRNYRETVQALSQLDDRELNDLGINRASIRYIAWTSAQ